MAQRSAPAGRVDRSRRAGAGCSRFRRRHGRVHGTSEGDRRSRRQTRSCGSLRHSPDVEDPVSSMRRPCRGFRGRSARRATVRVLRATGARRSACRSRQRRRWRAPASRSCDVACGRSPAPPRSPSCSCRQLDTVGAQITHASPDDAQHAFHAGAPPHRTHIPGPYESLAERASFLYSYCNCLVDRKSKLSRGVGKSIRIKVILVALRKRRGVSATAGRPQLPAAARRVGAHCVRRVASCSQGSGGVPTPTADARVRSS